MSTPASDAYERTPRTTVQRLPKRGAYDRALVHSILAEALVCHVGFVDGGQPFVIPTTFARIGELLYIHGSAASRMLRTLQGGIPVCVTVTLIDGLVLARSAFHHSMNYRSVVILGQATVVTDEGEKQRALDAIVDHVVPGRAAAVRAPNANELKGTLVLSLPLAECSAKVREGAPVDDDEDYALDVWAGVVPLELQPKAPVADPRLMAGIQTPTELLEYRR